MTAARPAAPPTTPAAPPTTAGAAPTGPPPAAQLRQLIGGYWNTQVVHVVARLGLADLIATGVRETGRLAAATETDPDALGRLLRAAAGLGLLTREPDGGHRLTPLGECLRSDHPQSVRHTAILAGDLQYRVWSELLHSVRTGRTAFPQVLGEPFFTYLAGHPATAETLHRALAEFATTAHIPALAGHDFGRTGTVVDVGGGTGVVLRHLLQANPGLRGILFDHPGIIAQAVPELRTGALAQRCQLAAGDFLQQVPPGGDSYLTSLVLHDFDDEPAARLLANIRAAIAPGGELVALELVLPDGDTPPAGTPGAGLAPLSDLNMLVTTGGRERTAAELERLLAGAGFRLDRIVPSPAPLKVVVAVPA